MKPHTLIVIICGIFLFTRWTLQFIGTDGWDIYHFMYAGQRLLEGELAWTEEYVDKLLVVQILFVIPALFGTIKAWFLLSAVFIALGAWSCFILVNYILSEVPNFSTKNRKFASICASVSSVYLFSVLPGGLMHVNATSSSLAVLSFALLFKSFSISKSSKIALMPFFLSALSASISIGIRPFFLVSIVVTVALLMASSSRPWTGHKGMLAIFGFWIILVGIFGISVNLIPYFVIGDMNAFWAGVSMLSQVPPTGKITSIIGNIIYDVWRQPLFTIFLIFLYLISAIFFIINLVWYKKIIFLPSKITNIIIILIIASPLLLLLLIISRHYWSHYLQMFVPFWSMGIGFFCIIFEKSFLGKQKKNFNIFWLLTICLVLITIIPSLSKNIKIIKEIAFDKKTMLSTGDIRLKEISSIVSNQPPDQRDFLFVDDMRPHFFLNEFRHGFPQAANSRHILIYGWWKNADMPNHFKHPINRKEYCKLLEERGPSLVFISDKIKDFELSCLERSLFYQLTQKLPTNFSLYQRN